MMTFKRAVQFIHHAVHVDEDIVVSFQNEIEFGGNECPL